MDFTDVKYMYHLVVWMEGLVIFGAPTSWNTSDLLNAQEMGTGITIFDGTYEEVNDMKNYLLDPINHVGKLDAKVYALIDEDYCGAMDIQRENVR